MESPVVEPIQSTAIDVTAPKNGLLKLIKQFSKFVVVGGINTAIDFIILRILVAVTGIVGGVGIIVLNSLSFSVAVVNSYFLNKHWTFEDKTQSTSTNEGFKFSQFFAVSLVGLAINGGIVYLITTHVSPVLGISHANWVLVGKLFATGVSLFWNFIGYKIFVFKS